MTYVIINGVIYTEDGVISDGYLIVEEGKIKAIETGAYTGDLEVVDAKDVTSYQVSLTCTSMVVMVKMRWTAHTMA